MTVFELKKILNMFEDDKEIEVAVRGYSLPVAIKDAFLFRNVLVLQTVGINKVDIYKNAESLFEGGK